MRGRGGAQAGGVKAAASRVMDVGLETLENLGPVPGLLVRLPAAAGPHLGHMNAETEKWELGKVWTTGGTDGRAGRGGG